MTCKCNHPIEEHEVLSSGNVTCQGKGDKYTLHLKRCACRDFVRRPAKESFFQGSDEGYGSEGNYL